MIYHRLKPGLLFTTEMVVELFCRGLKLQLKWLGESPEQKDVTIRCFPDFSPNI